MNSLTIPRARRPVKARVIAVMPPPLERAPVRLARACLGAEQERGARPGRPPRPHRAPRARPRRSPIPPVATSGRSHASRTRASSSSSGRSVAVVAPGAAMAAGLGALRDEHVGAARGGIAASAADVTVTQTAVPAACRRATSSADGQPKVERDHLDGAHRATTASFSSSPSSSNRGAPSSTPSRAASGCELGARRRRSPPRRRRSSRRQKRFDAERRRRSARAPARICSANASGVR